MGTTDRTQRRLLPSSERDLPVWIQKHFCKLAAVAPDVQYVCLLESLGEAIPLVFYGERAIELANQAGCNPAANVLNFEFLLRDLNARLVCRVHATDTSFAALNGIWPRHCSTLQSHVRSYFDRLELEFTSAVSNVFFDNKLRPSDCWQELLQIIDRYSGNWPSRAPREQSALQLLIVFGGTGGRSLKIVAALRAEGLNRFIRVDRSAAGILMRSGESFLIIDPSQYASVYRQYSRVLSRTEMMIGLRFSGRINAVLNVENEERDAYSNSYQWYVRLLFQWAGPFINGLQARHENFVKKEFSHRYIVARSLRRIAAVHGHDVTGPRTNAFLLLEEAFDALQSGRFASVSESLEKVREELGRIRGFTIRFIEDLPTYIKVCPIGVFSHIHDAIAPEIERLARKEQIFIEIDIEPSYTVFASTLFREHIFNLYRNSTQAIQRALSRNQISCGIIKITAARVVDRDRSQTETGLSYIEISITDNGGGASEQVLPFLGSFGVTTKQGGNGFALAAAREYCEGFGGKLQLSNVKMEGVGSGFEVTMTLQEYDSEIHAEEAPII